MFKLWIDNLRTPDGGWECPCGVRCEFESIYALESFLVKVNYHG